MKRGLENWTLDTIENNEWTTLVEGPCFLTTVLVSNTANSPLNIKMRISDVYEKETLFYLEPSVDINALNTEKFFIDSLYLHGNKRSPKENQKIQILASTDDAQALASGQIVRPNEGLNNWIISDIPDNKWVTVANDASFLTTIAVSNPTNTDAYISLRISDVYGKKNIFVLEPSVKIGALNTERYYVDSLHIRNDKDNVLDNQIIQIMSSIPGLQALTSGVIRK